LEPNDPGIQHFAENALISMDWRVKPGNDELERTARKCDRF
jgi:hypothetical protein